MATPKYTTELLINIIWETKDIEDHNKLIKLYQDLHEQDDINFSDTLKFVVKSEKHYFRFIKNISQMDKLCIFCLRLVDLQERGFATVTRALQRRIDFQREMILAKNKH